MPVSRKQPGTADEFLAARPGFDLSRFDTYDGTAVAGLKLPRRREQAILAQLRARQRMLAVTDDPAVAEALIGAGADSAHLIAAMPAHRFAREHADKFGGDEFAARQAHERARSVTAAVTHLHANLQGVLGSPHFAALHGNHTDPGLAAYFAAIPSYQDLFGSVDFCTCQHCGSIFGPAAYFTDLMRIIDDYITDANTISAGYRLAERRPDLFELPLTCANTNDLRPTLQIVVAILARRIAAARQAASGTARDGGPSSVTLAKSASRDDGAYAGMMIIISAGKGSGQTAAITRYTGATEVAEVAQRWDVVPDKTSGYVIAPDPYLTIATAPYPFNLPRNQPLARTRASLAALRVGLAEIYQALAAPVTGGSAQQVTADAKDVIKLAEGASSEDGAYATMTVALIGGTGAGQVRVITGYQGATRQATVAPPWQTGPDGTTQYHVFDTLGADREQLGLSAEQYAIVTTPVTDPDALAPYYGESAIDVDKLSRTEVFLARTGLTAPRLTALLTQGLSQAEQAAGKAEAFFINATGDGPAMRLGVDTREPNAPVPVIEHLSVARLDRLNRFIRLAAITGWEYEELDWALASVAAAATAPGTARAPGETPVTPLVPPARIDEAAVKALAGISRLVARTGLTVTELTAFWGPLKTTGRGDGRAPADLFDRVFNPPALLAGQNPYTSVEPIPFDPDRALPWNPAVTSGPDGVIRSRLTAALTVGDDDLTRLAEYVRALLGADELTLDLSTLSWLYRLAAAARSFRLTVEEYLVLLRLLYHPGQGRPAEGSFKPTVDTAAAQAERVDWFTRSDFTVYSVLYVLQGIRSPHYRPPYVPDDIAPFMTSLATSAQESRLTPESFAYGPVTQARSEQVFRDLVTRDVITGIGVVRDGTARYLQAARACPLNELSFRGGPVDAHQSQTAFGALQAADPPVLRPAPSVIGMATLDRSFTAQTDLSFLFPGLPDAANQRNQVRDVLLGTRRRIDVTEFAFLFPLAPASFVSRAITQAQADLAFDKLADEGDLLADPAAGQQRTITSYDGATRTATVGEAWSSLPGLESAYVITTQQTTGTARDGGPSSVTLAEDASSDDGAYTGMTITVTLGPDQHERSVITDYDGEHKVATTATPWADVPGEGAAYTVTSEVAAGRARGADGTHLTLDEDASPSDGAYDEMTVTIAKTGKLSASFDAGPLSFLFEEDPASGLKRGEVRQVLLATKAQIEHAADVTGAADALQQSYATQGLAGFLGTTTDQVAALIPVATGAADLGGYLTDLLTPIEGGQVPAGIPPFAAALSRALVLAGTLGMSARQTLAVTQMPTAFGVLDPQAVSFDDLGSLSAFMGLQRQFADTGGELLEYFRRPPDAGHPGPRTDALAALTGWPAEQIWQLSEQLWPDGQGRSDYGLGTATGIARLAACFDLSARTGLDVASLLTLATLANLAKLASLPAAGGDQDGGDRDGDGWQAYQAAARLTLDAVRARYGEAEFGQADAQIAATLNEQARDALVRYAIWVLHATHPEITDASSLYQYLLIDVEVAGCAQTSPVVQGIAALQLYLQRCRLGLETDTGVRDLSEIGAAWWEWVSAYRVWEANRRIFLYPENYLQPSLRRGASPEFTGLAQALLESDVTERSAAAAYQRYFEAFAVTGNLVICDAYQCPVPKAGTSVVRAQGTVTAATPTTVTLDPDASDLYNAYAGLRVSVTSSTGSVQVREITRYGLGRVAEVNEPWATEPDTASRYVITGPQLLDTLFLVGRTDTDPPAFYHRRHDPQHGWTPWHKVGVAIPALWPTPVYAFGKLHLFWVEQHSVESSKITSANAGSPQSSVLSSVSADVKYAYLDADGIWSAPQTAGSDLVSDYQENYKLDEYVDNMLPAELDAQFSSRVVHWQKAQPLHIPASKVTQPDRYPSGEQILLNYGLSLGFTAGQDTKDPGQRPGTAMPAAQHAFENGAYQLMAHCEAMANAPSETATGFLPFITNVTVSGTLTRSPVSAVFINDSPLEFPRPYYPALTRGADPAGKLVIAKSSTWNIIADNYWSDSYPGLADVLPPPAGDQLVLLANVSARDASLATVKNLPGSFIVGNGDETFLVRSSDAGIRPISDVLTATTDSAPFPAGFYYLRTWTYTSTHPAPDPFSLSYAFTRLSTTAARALSERLADGGLAGLLSLTAQRTPELPFSRLKPGAEAKKPATDTIDFDGAYGPYFWEIFFHAPFLVAQMLGASRRFREAKAWLEYIYNPTQPPTPGDEGIQRYWRFLPLRTMDLPTLTQILASPAQISAYNDQPFDPDAIARLRISAYAKAIVMRYVDNLLSWGDYLFAQDTRESVDEATNLYVLALDLLGPRPQPADDCKPPAPASYNDIKQAYANRPVTDGTARAAGPQTVTLAQTASEVDDAYTGMYLKITNPPGRSETGYITRYEGGSRTAHMEAPWTTTPASKPGYVVFVNGIPQFLIRLENTAPVLAAGRAGVRYQGTPFNDIGTYFCVPENDQLIGYWDRAEDRLFKIRHCLNIDGVARALPLFAPPVSPAVLVAAAAAGSAGQAVASQLNLPVPFYRFTMLIGQARELAGTVAALGSGLLAALEKKDAEALALLQVSQQQALLDMSTAVKELTIEQTAQADEALAAALAAAQDRQTYYSGLVAGGLSPAELENIAAMHRAKSFNLAATIIRAASSVGFALPQLGSPFAMTYGGQQVGSVLSAVAGGLDAGAVLATFDSQLALTMSQYERRELDWTLQQRLAERDAEQIQAQIAANQTQATIAERDLAIHLTAMAQNEAVSRFLTTKFTSAELYQWMSTRLSALHFQTYTLALDLARAAQRAFQYELNADTTFVNFGYWDGARRGLLAGEGLLLALHQMEKAYAERNTRALQIEKTISLGSLDPLALRDLVETGECTFTLTEKLFDDDYPGHYARKISALSVSIPAITGPYQNLHATLTQLANQVVIGPDVNAVDFLLGGENATPPGPDKLRTDWWVNQQIAISAGLGDDGVFDTNPMDGRLLPFEGTGAVSSWRLSMPRPTNHFDFDAISDVILTLRYQAFDGGARFRDQVVKLPAMSSYTGSVRLPLAQVFSSQWYEFLHTQDAPEPQDPQDPQTQTQTLRFTLADLVPPHIADPKLTAFSLHLQVPDGTRTAGGQPYLRLRLGSRLDTTFNLSTLADHTQIVTDTPQITDITGPGSLEFILGDTPGDLKPSGRLDPAVLHNATLVLIYQGTISWPSARSR